MTAVTNNYDPVAIYYDRLSQMVLGKAPLRAQTCLLQYIKQEDSILIVGGGTGWILEAIAALDQKDLRIVFVDISAKMIALAKQRKHQSLQVEFINSSIEELHLVTPFDIIISSFLFDNFNQRSARKNFIHLGHLLRPKGYWLFTDFFSNATSPLWHKFLLWMMYAFFRRTASVEAKKLPDMNGLFLQNGYQRCFHACHYGKFIQSIVWQKT